MFFKNYIFILTLILLFNNVLGYTETECDAQTKQNCTCIKEPCIRKCCRYDELLDNTNSCIKVNRDMNFDQKSAKFEIYNDDGQNKTLELREIDSIVYGMPCQGELAFPFSGQNNSYDLYSNGSILLIHEDETQIHHTHNDSCVDFQITGESNSTEIKKIAIVCLTVEYEKLKLVFYTTFLVFISIPLILLTLYLLVYVIGIKNKLQLKIIVSEISMLAIGYTALAAIRLGFITTEPENNMCYIVGYMSYYSFLSHFFWLNVMSFDRFLIFRIFSARNLDKSAQDKWYIKYACYGWGMPIPILLTAFISDLVIDFDDISWYSILKANFGKESCLFGEGVESFIYFHFPLTILMVSNILFYSIVAVKLYLHYKGLRKFNDTVKITKEKERLKEYFKLFLTMGIIWILEPISFYFNNEPELLWAFTDSLNLLQGITIFIICVCKRRRLRVINKKLFPRYPIFINLPAETNASDNNSSVSSTASATTNSRKSSRLRSSNKKTENKNFNEVSMKPFS